MSDLTQKRPPKSLTVAFILSQIACLVEEVPFISPDSVKAQILHGNYYLYRSEVDKIVEEYKGKEGFDVSIFMAVLTDAEAIKEAKAPVFGSGEGIVRITSEKRAKEVSNTGTEEDIKNIMKGMEMMQDIREKLSPLINLNATISIALKNKKSKKDNSESAEEEPTSEVATA